MRGIGLSSKIRSVHVSCKTAYFPSLDKPFSAVQVSQVGRSSSCPSANLHMLRKREKSDGQRPYYFMTLHVDFVTPDDCWG